MTDNIFQAKKDRFLLLSGLPNFTPGGQRVPQGGTASGLTERFEDAERSRARILKAQRKKRKKSSKKKRKEQRLQAQFPRPAGRISEGNLVFTTPQVEADLRRTKELVELKKEKLRILRDEREQNARLEDRKLRIQTEQIRAGQIRDARERGLAHRRLNEEARQFDIDVRQRDDDRQAKLQRIRLEQDTIRDLNAREDARRAQEIADERDRALTELGIRGEERQRELENERFKIERERQVDADRAQSDRDREESFRDLIDLLRHNKPPSEFGGQSGNREPSAIDELIDAVQEVGQRAKARKAGGGSPPRSPSPTPQRQRRGTIVSPAVGGGVRSPRTPQPEPAPSLADEDEQQPRRSSRRQTATPRTTRNTTPAWERRGEGAGRRLYRVEEEVGLPPSPQQGSLRTAEPETEPIDRAPPGLVRQPSESPSLPATEVGSPRQNIEVAEDFAEQLRARREARQGGGEEGDET